MTDTIVLPGAGAVTPGALDPLTEIVIEVNGERVASGESSTALPLALGETSFSVLVTAETGVSRSYGVRVVRDVDPSVYLKASNTEAGDWFGAAIALSGDTLAIGAYQEDSAATGAGGDSTDNSISASGAVYVFVRDAAGVWAQQAYLKASNPGSGDYFGFSLAIDGDTLVVGAYGEDSNAIGIDGDPLDDTAFDAGAAYVFVRDAAGAWSQQAYLKSSNSEISDSFGWDVDVSGDTLAVSSRFEAGGAPGVGADQADNTAVAAGAVYIFVRDAAGAWSQQAYVKASNPSIGDFFGSDLALGGDTLVVGAYGEDSAATGVGGDAADDSASGAGAVYVFARDVAGVWSEQAYIKASNAEANDAFGSAVALSGDTLAVSARFEDSAALGVGGDESDNSATDSGAVYVFVRDVAGLWSQQAYVKPLASDISDRFGYRVALSGELLAVTTYDEDSGATGVNGNAADDTAPRSGAGYLFVRGSTDAWSQLLYLKASNTESNDLFGMDVALSGDWLCLGAPEEASVATGIDGDQLDNSAPMAGAAYLFRLQ